MISINKIREKSGLLLIIMCVTMLLFILNDLFSSKQGQSPQTIGEVAGENVEISDFEKLVQQQEQTIESTGQQLDENAREQIRTQVWNRIVRDMTIATEINKVGIDISAAEYDDIRFGSNILPDYKNNKMFQDPATGAFDPQRVKQYFQNIQTNYPMYWAAERDNIIEARKMAKYDNLIKKGIYVNKLEAQNEYTANGRKLNVNFVMGRFSSIPDSTIKPSDDELKTWFNAHKVEKRFEQVESRSLEYVTFDVKATPEDIKATTDEVEALVAPFQAATSDSLFVVNNSDQKFYQPEVYQKGSTDPVTDSIITHASKGTVLKPYVQGDQLRLAKVVANGQIHEVFARHILLKPSNGETMDQLKAKADSLKTEIKKNDNFAAVAAAISQDPGSAQQGGDLEWISVGSRMVKPFEDAVVKLNKGEMAICETEFGVHLIEAKDARETEQTKLAVVERSLAPSKTSVNEIYEKATAFSQKYKTTEEFNKGAEAEKLTKVPAKNIAPQNKFIPGLADPTQVIRWMNNAEVGDVSEPIEVGNQFVVANLTLITEEGTPSLDAIKDQVEREVIKEKKAELIKAKIKGTNLATIATALGETVQSVPDLTFNTPAIPMGGRELKVIGTATAMAKNTVSKPIVGENGVFVVQVVNVTDAPAVKDLTPIKTEVTVRNISRSDRAAFGALVEKAKVKDLRYKFY